MKEKSGPTAIPFNGCPNTLRISHKVCDIVLELIIYINLVCFKMSVRHVQYVLCNHFQTKHPPPPREAHWPAITWKWISLATTLLLFQMGPTYSVIRPLFLRSPSRWNRISGGSIGASPGGPGGPGGPAGPCSPFVPATPSEPFGPGGPSRPGNPGGPSLPFWPWGPGGPCSYSSKIFSSRIS